MKEKNIKKNYIFNLVYQLVALVTPLITTPYISRVLNPDGIGQYSYSGSIVAYFILFATLGIPTYGQREISYVQGDRNKRAKVFWNAETLRVLASLISISFFFVFAFFQENKTIYYILSITLIASVLDITWFFYGMEEFGKIVFRDLIIKVLNIIFIFTAIKSSDDLLLYVFGVAIFGFVSNIAMWFYLPRYIGKIDRAELKPLKQLPAVLALFAPTIAMQVYSVLDKTMIGFITHSNFENGYYEQAMKISKLTLTVISSLVTVMIPRSGLFFINNERQKLDELMYKSYRFVWFLGLPMCMGLIAVSDLLVPWFFGPGYDKVIELLAILAFLILVIGVSNVTGLVYLIPTKRQNIFTMSVTAGAVINLVLNACLIPAFGSIGAAAASVAAETVIAVIQLVAIKKELNIRTILRQGFHYIVATAVMFCVLMLIKPFFVSTMLDTGIVIAIGAVVYFLILLLLKDQFLIQNVNAVLSGIKSKIRGFRTTQ